MDKIRFGLLFVADLGRVTFMVDARIKLSWLCISCESF